MRGLRGKLNWTRGEGVPNDSGDASLLSNALPNWQVTDLIEANAALMGVQGPERHDPYQVHPLFPTTSCGLV